MAKVCIVPDVHGRRFWEKAKDFNGPIVFLGDYFDPYWGEKGVDTDIKALFENFENIKKFAESNLNVTLLMGNHDFHYLTGLSISTRYNDEHAAAIAASLRHADLVKAVAIEGTLFTHAALNREWVQEGYEINNAKEAAAYIKAQPDGRMAIVPRHRGGMWPYGSPIWDDAMDMKPENIFPFLQICGHTQMEKTGDTYQNGTITCIDSRCCFIYDTEDHTLTPIK